MEPVHAAHFRAPGPAATADGSVRDAGAELADIAWSYEHPLEEAAGVTGLIAFFDERIDVVLDGVRRPRPVTPWSRGPG